MIKFSLVDGETASSSSKQPEITKRRIQIEGVQVFDRFYFHAELAGFIGESVEVRYDAAHREQVTVILPNQRSVVAETIMVVQNDNEFVDNAFELIRVKATNQQMLAALSSALELRGIFVGLSDPLALVGEKARLCDRYKEIEKQIRAAIEKGRDRQ